MIFRVQQLGPGMIQQIQTVCHDCGGQGERVNPADRCKACQGKKIIKDKKIIQVHVDRGMQDGEKITLHGEGDQEPGVSPGDIVIVLDEKPHPVFKRSTHDLIVHIDLELVEALCGFQKTIETLDQRQLLITTIPGEVIKPGEIKCVMNEGMPVSGDYTHRGKLIIQFNVAFPKMIDSGVVGQLENCLPGRTECIIPDDAEEVTLHDFDPKAHNRSHRAAYDEDDDDEEGGGGPRGVQCQSH